MTKTKKVHCKMLSQDIYLREHSSLAERDVQSVSQKTYYELQRDTIANGIKENLVSVEYPVTTDSVNSHVQSADYRNDVVSAVNQPPRGVNLGDLTVYQNFIAQNPAEALRVYQETVAKLSKAVSLEEPAKQTETKGEEK